MAKKKSALSAASKEVDPALDALFAGSAGPVTALPKTRYAELLPARPEEAGTTSGEEDDLDGDLSELSEVEGSLSDADGSPSEDDSEDGSEDGNEENMSEDEEAAAARILEAAATSDAMSEKKDRKRKRKQRDEYDDLESKHLQKLAKDDGEPVGKRLKGENGVEEPVEENDATEKNDNDDDDDDVIPVHETVAADPAAADLEQASRTIFLSNVSVEAITSRKAKKTLLAHLASVLDKAASPAQTVQSIRFRSTAFATAAIPKRAAFIKKSVMDATTKSTNAYVVYSTASAVRMAVAQLNGTVVLGRHLRVDSVAHPATVDHRRCVFVGNLGFVDDESVLASKTDEDGKEVTEKRKRTKAPMDVEEGLWRVFGKEAGKVESVRVIRDPVTRVGKGFAYVQFYNANGVEAALLLEGKKFPPMLPRTLRVGRCKAPHKTARAAEAKAAKAAILAGVKPNGRDNKKRKSVSDYVPKPTGEAQTLAGRAGKLLGRAGGAKAAGRTDGKKGDRRASRRASGTDNNKGAAAAAAGDGEAAPAFKSPEEVIFEGRRASAKDGKPKDLRFKGSRPAGKAGGPKRPSKSAKDGRGGVRAAKWRAQGGSKREKK